MHILPGFSIHFAHGIVVSHGAESSESVLVEVYCELGELKLLYPINSRFICHDERPRRHLQLAPSTRDEGARRGRWNGYFLYPFYYPLLCQINQTIIHFNVGFIRLFSQLG